MALFMVNNIYFAIVIKLFYIKVNLLKMCITTVDLYPTVILISLENIILYSNI